jgi:HEAT repeat protein
MLLGLLEDERFEIRWLAAEGLIRVGRPVVERILQALLERPESIWLRQGAHRIFRDFERADLRDILHPVSLAIESDDPPVRIPVAVEEALGKLHGH